MRKRLIKVVDLRFFCDDVNGEYGLTHKETIKEGFNAFWGTIGIFHDVWEHEHEYTHKYFRGSYAMNVGGEMAAMGKMWYYQDELGLGNARNLSQYSIYSEGDRMRQTTQMEIQEAIQSGYCQFGSTLESRVPKQRPVDNEELEYQIEKMWEDIRSYHYSGNTEYSDDNEKKASTEYKQSCNFRKIADLHRWGYRQGEKLVPYSWENRNTLREFIEFWGSFCKNNIAEELQNYYKGIEFRIYKTGDAVSWKAKLISNSYEIKDVPIISVHEVYPEEMANAW